MGDLRSEEQRSSGGAKRTCYMRELLGTSASKCMPPQYNTCTVLRALRPPPTSLQSKHEMRLKLPRCRRAARTETADRAGSWRRALCYINNKEHGGQPENFSEKAPRRRRH